MVYSYNVTLFSNKNEQTITADESHKHNTKQKSPNTEMHTLFELIQIECKTIRKLLWEVVSLAEARDRKEEEGEFLNVLGLKAGSIA